MCFHVNCLAHGGCISYTCFWGKFLDKNVDGVILQEELWKCPSHCKYEHLFDTFGRVETGWALLGVNWQQKAACLFIHKFAEAMCY